MHRSLIVFGFAATLTLAGCTAHNPPTTTPPSATSPNLPEPPPPPSRGSKPSDDDITAIRPAVADLVRRAQANDEAFFRGVMPGADAGQVADMIRRINGVDMNANYPQHLAVNDAATAHLNYHDPCHVQIDLKRGAGPWTVSRLWFCR